MARLVCVQAVMRLAAGSVACAVPGARACFAGSDAGEAVLARIADASADAWAGDKPADAALLATDTRANGD